MKKQKEKKSEVKKESKSAYYAFGAIRTNLILVNDSTITTSVIYNTQVSKAS